MRKLMWIGRPPVVFALVVCGLLAALAAAPAPRLGHAQFGETFVVDTVADTGDANAGDGVCDTGDGSCTLRAAIEETNASVFAGNRIHFDIPGSGPHTIAPLSLLPPLDSNQLVIDGRTQPGFAEFGTRQIELAGGDAGAGPGFEILAGQVEIWGLAINDWSGAGILIRGTGNNKIERNYIGTNVFGDANQPNVTGIDIEGSQTNRIAGNVISGNIEHGVRVIGATAGNTTITSNIIGLDASGQQAVPNGLDGIFLGAPNASINDNVISGNLDAGVNIFGGSSTLNDVVDNLIGTDESGSAAVGNGVGVVVESAPENFIEGNTISGNMVWGISLVEASDTVIALNQIGTDIGGGAAVPNNAAALPFGGGVSIDGGGANVIEGNRISGNNLDGVFVTGVSVGNIFDDNAIGVAAGGGALPNTGNGILIDDGDDNQIVGSAGVNEIAFNGEDGVAIDFGTGNTIQNNSIHDNKELGIDLDLDEVTPNDFLDADFGPNDRQNFPTIWQDQQGNFSGLLRSTPITAFTIEIYQNVLPDPTGHGEGLTLVDVVNVVTDPLGEAHFDVPNVMHPRATATDPLGNTSEFGPLVLHGPSGIDLPPPYWIEPRDDDGAIVFFGATVSNAIFDITGNPGATPQLGVSKGGSIAFGEPARTPPPGGVAGGGSICYISLLPEGTFSVGFDAIELESACSGYFHGAKPGDALGGGGIFFEDRNADELLDLLFPRPPASFSSTQQSSDPYVGPAINTITGEVEWAVWTAPGEGTLLPPEVDFLFGPPPNIGADLEEVSAQSGIPELDVPGTFGDTTGVEPFGLGGFTFYGRYTADLFDARDAREPLATTFSARFPGGGDISDVSIFTDGFESGDTSAWSDTVPWPELRSRSDEEVRVAQASPFCADFCAAVVVDAPTPAGAATIYLLDLAAVPSLGDHTITGDEPWVRVITDVVGGARGVAVSLGDLDADGALDLVVGVPNGRADDFGDRVAPQTGMVYVLNGPLDSGPLPQLTTRAIAGLSANEAFGGDVAISDVSRDGILDILITSKQARQTSGSAARGALTIVRGARPVVSNVQSDGVTTVVSGANLDAVVLLDGVRAEVFSASSTRVEVLGSGEAVVVDGVFGRAQEGGAPGGVFLSPAWNLTGWRGPVAPVAGGTESIAGQFDGLFTWDASAQSFLAFNPDLPGTLNTLSDLAPGDGVWIFVDNPAGATWDMPDIDTARDVALQAGFNLVVWTGPDGMPVADAVAALGDGLLGLWIWDAPAQQFLTFNPALPPALNTAATLPYGAGMWVRMGGPATWSQPAR